MNNEGKYNEEMDARHYVETMVEQELMEELGEIADCYGCNPFLIRARFGRISGSSSILKMTTSKRTN